MAEPRLVAAGPGDLEQLLPLVAGYHDFEGIGIDDAGRRRTVARLLDEPLLGRVWLIETDAGTVGYIAVCFGYSIELGGRDAFIDEFFLVGPARGQGIGGRVLREIKDLLGAAGIVAVHLEVDPQNAPAQRLYAAEGFRLRAFRLMTMQPAPRGGHPGSGPAGGARHR